MKPSSRFLLVGIAWVVLFALLAAAGVIWQTRHGAQVRSLKRLQTAATVEARLQHARSDQLQLRASVLANDSAFVAYVAHALIPNPAMGGTVDSLSISDLLNQRRQGYDVAMVLDSHGDPVAASGVLLKDHASIARDALVTKSMATLKPTHGMWASHGRLWWVSVNPLLRGGALHGLLLAATRVDNAFASAIAHATNSDIAIVVRGTDGTPAAQSDGLDPWKTRVLTAEAPTLLDVQDRHGRALTLADTRHATPAWITPLPGSHGQAVMVALAAGAGSHQLAGPVAWRLLVGIAILGMAAMFLVIAHWRRTCAPVDHMCDVIGHAAEGDHFMHARVDGSALVRQLRDALNRLLERDRA